MKRLSWKYIAGMVDGEGCLDVQISKGKYFTPRVRIAMAEPGKDVLIMLQNSFGGSLVKREHSNPDWTQAWSWELTGFKRLVPFLRNIVNHLIIKREQARFIIWMESLKGMKHKNTELREFARNELKAMKIDPHRLSEKAQESILEML